MDTSRIDAELFNIISSLDLKLDVDVLKNNPEKIQQARAVMAKTTMPLPPENITVEDIYIPSTQGHQLRFRVYIPKERKSDAVMLYFHGGGYVFGLPEQVERIMFRMAQDIGYPIVSVDYRLSPQNPFPAALHDAYDALLWLSKDGCDILQVNPRKIVVHGASAGGHLAATLTQFSRDNNGPEIYFQFLLYPVIHNRLDTSSMLEFTDTPFWNRPYAQACWTHFLGEERLNEKLQYADLLYSGNLQHLPKGVVVACELDPLRDEAIDYAQRLL
ncbi:MAG TPA: alpha/beta hydrolase, partial [Arachidicoccus sp.]